MRDKKTTRCTKEEPWDGKALPVLHVDAEFILDTDILLCPHCRHSWNAES